MRVLLDTCSFLWLIRGDQALSKTARAVVADSDNEVSLSAASAWEIAIKYSLGKLPLPDDPLRYVPKGRALHGIDEKPVRESEVLSVRRLPPLHKDPFDRILIAQAIENGLTILTPDENIRQYPVKSLW